MITKKPDPIIEKIDLTEEQKQEIKRLLDGKPPKELIEKWDKRCVKPRYYLPPSKNLRLNEIKKKYFKRSGFCTICREFPIYKVSYKMDGITLCEYYCEKHKDWMNQN